MENISTGETMEKNILISVLMVNYNKEDVIAETIESVLGQTYNNIQFIIVDDGSTDRSADIIRKYADRDPRIESYLCKENKKVCAVTNFGFTKVKGEYLARIDSDDTWEPEKLVKQLEFMLAHEACEICLTGANIIDEEGHLINDSEPMLDYMCNLPEMSSEENLRWLFCRGNYLVHPTVMMKAKFRELLGGFNPAFGQLHDYEYWVRAAKKTHIYKMPERYTNWRRFQNEREKNMSNSAKEAQIRMLNESVLISSHFFEDMSDELFSRAFRCMFQNPEAASPEEYACEKAFLLCGKYKLKELYQPLPGMLALERLLSEPRYQQVLQDVYQYLPSHFYREMTQHLFMDKYIQEEMQERDYKIQLIWTAKTEAEQAQRILEKRLETAEMQVKRYQELMEKSASLSAELDQVKDQKNELQKTLEIISASKSWKLTAPVRHILDKLKK